MSFFNLLSYGQDRRGRTVSGPVSVVLFSNLVLEQEIGFLVPSILMDS